MSATNVSGATRPTPESREQLLEDLIGAAVESLPALVADLHPAVLADLLEAMPPERRLAVWLAAPDPARGEALTELHDEVLAALAAEADPEILSAVMAPLQPDELADLQHQVPEAAFAAALERLDPDKRLRVDRVRHYPEDVAGGLMDVDAQSIHPDLTIDAALTELRQHRLAGHSLPEHLDTLFVVGDGERLLGRLPLADMVSLSPDTRVSAAMSDAVALPVDLPVAEVARTFKDHDLLSAPVVNGGGKLLGRITVDDVIDVVSEDAERSILAPAGLDEDKDLFAPLRTALRQRGLWLAINLCSAFLAALVIGQFETAIERLVALAVLMPVVASMGGAAGQQSLALVIRGLALNHVGRANRMRLLRQEMVNGVVIGLFFAVAVGAAAWLWFGLYELALLVAIALACNVIIGTTMGTVYPLVMQRFGIDPALAGGMALTATTDVLGFFALLGLATAVLL